ncbi:putative vesicular acetylcholine transporter-A [Tubulanus polymorphus]|uniref:putative vesicular acetylcholine transporter-A n=1 Tax=Tubulanus polymorphus TaxID=672921 RepID=UPI003DA31C41
MTVSAESWFNSFRSSKLLVKIITFVALLLHTLTTSTIVPLLPPMLVKIGRTPTGGNASSFDSFGASDIYARNLTEISNFSGALGYIVSARWIADFLFTIVTGFLVDRFGNRWPMLVGVLFNMTSIFGYAFVPNIASLIVFRVLQGIGASLTYVSSLALISETFQDDSERNKALSQVFLGYTVGLLLGYAVGPILFRFTNLMVPFLLLGVLASVDGLLRILKPTDDTNTRQDAKNVKISKYCVILFEPYILAGLICNLSLFFGLGIYLATGADWMIYHLRADMWQIGLVLFISLLFMILGDLLAGWYSLKYQWAWLIIALWLYASGMAIYPACTSIWHVIGTEGLARFGIGIGLCCINSLLARVTDLRFGNATYGVTFGLFAATVDLGSILGSLFGGFLVDKMTFDWLYRAEAIFVFLASFSALIYRKMPAAVKDTGKYEKFPAGENCD